MRFLIYISALLSLAGCGFHLRGISGSYQFPYSRVYLRCEDAVICDNLRKTIIQEYLTRLVDKPESADVTIRVSNEQTSRDANAYNAVGQISSYLLTYQITAQVFDKSGEQLGANIVITEHEQMAYNNSLILSAQIQEQNSWENLHEDVINALIRKIVYLPTKEYNANNH